MLQLWSAAAVVSVALVAVFAWTFVVLYSRVRWFENPYGRHLMRLRACLAIVFSLVLLSHVVEFDPLVSAVLSTVFFGWLAWEITVSIRLMLRSQREHSRIPR